MNQAASHRASVSNANGHCNITAVAKFDKIGTLCLVPMDRRDVC